MHLSQTKKTHFGRVNSTPEDIFFCFMIHLKTTSGNLQRNSTNHKHAVLLFMNSQLVFNNRNKILISSFFETHFRIKTSHKKRRFDLSEIIFKL